MEGFYGRRGRREARSYGSVAAEVRGLQLSGLHAANPYKQSLSLIQWLVNCNGDSILSSKFKKSSIWFGTSSKTQVLTVKEPVLP